MQKVGIDQETEARSQLRVILSLFEMLRSGNKAQYDFLLEMLSHTIQYPEKKLGIALCLVGDRGTGKTLIWNLLRALVGAGSSFETDNPQKDIFGDNNSCMLGQYIIRITEAKREKFAAFIGEMR